MADVDVDLRRLSERLAPAEVAGIRPLSGGASSLTYVGTMAGNDTRRVVVKVAPAGFPPVRNRDVLRQARMLRALRPTAVPVPDVLWEDAGDPPDVPPLFVMSFVEGTSVEPLFDVDVDVEGDEDATLVAVRMCNAARTMAALHALDPDGLGLSGEPFVGPADEIDRWSRVLETVDRQLAPGWETVAAALRADVPLALPGVVVHGDFRLGNALAAGDRIAAVVDWEIWSVGDPRADVGWFLMNADPGTYRRVTRYVDSLPTPAELAAIYVGVFGREVRGLEWFQALACFKAAATWSLIMKHNRRRGAPDPAVEQMATAVPHLLERAHALLR
jgi:aminoglycoside phosphotransferase (APT) family kinase protein